MFKQIFGTLFTRLSVTLLGFLIVVFNAQSLGADGVGVISLIILAITIFIMFNDICGGGALTYLIPRNNLNTILIPCYVWALIIFTCFWIIIKFVDIVPATYRFDAILLGLLASINGINNSVLTAKQRINLFNIIFALQNLTIFVFLVVNYFLLKNRTVDVYVTGLYISYLQSFVLSILLVFYYMKKEKLSFEKEKIVSLFKFGFLGSIAQITQLMNYRFTYFIIEKYLGLAPLGRFGVSMQVSETATILSRSIATVQYSNIANSNNPDEHKKMTLVFFKITGLLTFLILLFLIFLPEELYLKVFGKDFINISVLILLLAPGIFALAVKTILSHYFSGVGKLHVNTISSTIGFGATLIFSFAMIPFWGIYGAALATTVAHIASFVYSLIVFIKISDTQAREFIPTVSEIKLFYIRIMEKIKKKP